MDCGKHFDLLFQSRQKGDYSDYIIFEATEVQDWQDKTKDFVDHIRNYLSNHYDL